MKTPMKKSKIGKNVGGPINMHRYETPSLSGSSGFCPASNQMNQSLVSFFEVAPLEKKSPFDESSYDVSYEALSWTWDSERSAVHVTIQDNDHQYLLPVSNNLFQALTSLRLETASRTLWINALCINQANSWELNHQMPMLPSIYANASRVCVWLGPASKDSTPAIELIEEMMHDLSTFGELLKSFERNTNGQYHNSEAFDLNKKPAGLKALLDLIMRQWFSRRWIIQGIALATDALLYCGRNAINWHTFSSAVSLLVEQETKDHRLSNFIQRQAIFDYVPDMFENVAHLSAPLLIETTHSLFNRFSLSEKENLLSLEYLVSGLSIFNSAEPRGAIYALLPLARDAIPVPPDNDEKPKSLANQLAYRLSRNLGRQPFVVDYDLPYVYTCTNFLKFCILQSEKTRALDILCRSWAPHVRSEEGNSFKVVPTKANTRYASRHKQELPSWIKDVKDATFKVYMGKTIGRINADPLVGLPPPDQSNYSAAASRPLDTLALRFAKRSDHFSIFVRGFVLDRIDHVQQTALGHQLPRAWLEAGGWEDLEEVPPEALWRTLVANRETNGKRPQGYYPQALRDVARKGFHGSSLDMHYWIQYGQSDPIANVLRRVHQVILNKRLLLSEDRRLGLAHDKARTGDLLCILYGCTVPVILRQREISEEQYGRELEEDEKARMTEAFTAFRKQIDLSKKRQKRPNRDKAPSKARSAKSESLVTSVWSTYQIFASLFLPLYLGLSITIWAGVSGYKFLFWSVVAGLLIHFLLFFGGLLQRMWSRIRQRADKPIRSQEPRKPQDGETKRFYYELIGDCYLHDMMDGDAMSYKTREGIVSQTFEIR